MARETWWGKHPGHDEEAAVRADNARLRAEVARLTQERDEARDHLERNTRVAQDQYDRASVVLATTTERVLPAVEQIARERDALRALLGQMAEALREYGRHRGRCDLYRNPLGFYVPPPDAKCTCGLSAALTAAAPSLR